MYHQKSALFAAVATLFLSSFMTSVEAAEVCYEGGLMLPNFKINGNAMLDGTDILVTPSEEGMKASFFYYPKFSTSADFHIKLKIKISQNYNGGADGMAFVMHNDPKGVLAIGISGQGIGYEGISNSVVVEFDTYKNSDYGDPDDNHVAITKEGSADHYAPQNSGMPLVTPSVTLKSGSPVTLWIDYTIADTTLKVYMNTTDAKPAGPTLSKVLNLTVLLGSSFYMGFSGSTGGSWSKHEVMTLYATDLGSNPEASCCDNNADCAASTAGTVCDTVKKLCGQCIIGDLSGCGAGAQACNLESSNDICSTPCTTSADCTSVSYPACLTSGPGAGSCSSCNGDNGTTAVFICPSGAPFCSSTGYCGRCSLDAECGCSAGIGHMSLKCDVSSGTCDGCASDSDCCGLYFCNGTSVGCVPLLASGSPIPNDGIHDGKCNAANKALCVSGDCNPTANTCASPNGESCTLANECVVNFCGSNGKCGLANGDQGCTAGTADPACQSLICSAGGYCIPSAGACAVDSDCAQGNYCDRANFACVAKLQSGAAIPSDGLHDGTCNAQNKAVCLSGDCNAVTNTCASASNTACTNANQCVANICESDGLCGLRSGESCTTDTQCRSGQCSNGFCAGGGGESGGGCSCSRVTAS